ncbi:hypothetical protein [Micromonospora sp. HUAS LYJ1]|uniref:hypothetical protein n=1 Tax=Micromonospora TaxID=1873 RepID=UPI002671D0F7|nr:hypothetical protein [Micromonospora sp. HUAS LYJ1]WKU02457.1 hypothetical protein Q2K16_16115 [Micromonospora sp. HUAS LYJ1]
MTSALVDRFLSERRFPNRIFSDEIAAVPRMALSVAPGAGRRVRRVEDTTEAMS